MQDRALAPLKLSPFLSRPLWGGHILASRYAKDADPHASIGESWEIYDADQVVDGPFAGHTLRDVATSLGERLLGSHASHSGHDAFPLLIKLIDAARQLSIQVHPNDEQARRLEHVPFGKTEAWHILQAQSGAKLIYGVKRLLTVDELVRGANDGDLERDVCEIEVAAGDTVYVPAGTIHSIGAGILLYEVQQTSETTYRLYDWRRLDSAGKPRELHVEKAAQVALLAPSSEGVRHLRDCRRTSSGAIELVRCPYFLVERVDVSEPMSRDPGWQSFEAVTVIQGDVRLVSSSNAWPPVPVRAGQSVLVPAASDPYRIVSTEGTAASALISSIPAPSSSTIVKPNT